MPEPEPVYCPGPGNPNDPNSELLIMKSETKQHYVVRKISKGGGRFRTIWCPDAETKKLLRETLPVIMKLLEKLNTGHLHGFMPNRSPVTNAMAHVGWKYSTSWDLADFFDSVSPEHIKWVCRKHGLACTNKAARFVLEHCFPDGIARQGLPTSPALANIAGTLIDGDVLALQKSGRFCNYVYTRYADDMTFSYDSESVGEWLKMVVPTICEKYGFKINPSKTKTMCAINGRRMITGVAVGPDGIHLPRETRRRLRAAEHQILNGLKERGERRMRDLQNEKRWRRHKKSPLKYLLKAHADGLGEWAKLTLPKKFLEEQKAKGKQMFSQNKVEQSKQHSHQFGRRSI